MIMNDLHGAVDDLPPFLQVNTPQTERTSTGDPPAHNDAVSAAISDALANQIYLLRAGSGDYDDPRIEALGSQLFA
jgi:hypothetical protein